MSTPESPGHSQLRRQAPGFAAPEQAALTVQEQLHGSGPACHGAAERRQLSIMFCDVADSTALSSRLDPEDLSAVIREYQLRVAAAIACFGGFIARYVGDGVLIYFGWPAAHEANAEQAVRAALAVIEAVNRTPVRTESLHVRIGIATGLVVIGEPIGTGWARQQTAIGEAPNLAARLQALAGPNGVIIDAATRRQIGALFTCRDLGPVTLKGLPDAVSAWQVTGPAAFSSRSETVHAATAPLLGREDELALMLRAWTQARSGSGQVVLLSGEPGIGKSRLAACLLERLVQEPHTALHYFCSPQHQDTPLFPVVTGLERAAGLERSDAPAIRLAKINRLLAQAEMPNEQAAALAGLMGCTDRSAPCVQGQRERLLEAMTGHLAALAARQPVVLLFEDAHWIDPTSLELLSWLVARIRSLPVLLVISFRPEFRPPWAGLPHVTALPLGGLRRREARLLAEQTAGTAALPAGTARQIIDHAQGIPLFIEELTRAAVEADWHDVMSRSAPPGAALPEPAIPTALYTSLAARLDRLPDARDVAQVAAVIGREFSSDLLVAVAACPEPALERALVRLVEAGLVTPHGTTPRADYAFRHSLIRDVAYSMQLRDRRRQLHAQVAEALRQHFPEQAAPELLARHYALAGLIEPAARYLLLAAQHAFTASAYHEATSHLRNGFELIERLPEGPLRTRFQLDLKATLSLVRDASKGYGHMFQPVFTSWRWRPVWDGNSLDG